MSCPFPGMDPFLEDEDLWPGFQVSFLVYAGDLLIATLPVVYDARIGHRRSARKESPGTMMVLDDPDERYIEIRCRPDRRIVTALELSSPWDKRAGRQRYLKRREALLREGVNLVELDLLRDGDPIAPSRILPAAHYYAFITRAENRPQGQVYAWTIRQPLPALPIPLRAPDPDLRLDIQAVFTTAYERGRYTRALDYARPVAGPLSDADRAWVADRVQGMA